MTTLTDNEKKFLNILEELDNDSFWGVAISEVIKNPEPVMLRRLITELKSQAGDNYMVMQSIIGEPGIQCLQTL